MDSAKLFFPRHAQIRLHPEEAAGIVDAQAGLL
jgi:hypothetical protein